MPPKDPSTSHAMCLPAPKDPVSSVASSPRPICPCCIQDHHSPLIACVLTPHLHHPSTAVCHPGHVTSSEAHHLKHIIRDIIRGTSSETSPIHAWNYRCSCHPVHPETSSEVHPPSPAYHPRHHPYNLGITDASSLVSNHLWAHLNINQSSLKSISKFWSMASSSIESLSIVWMLD